MSKKLQPAAETNGISVKDYAKLCNISVQAAHKRFNKPTLPNGVAAIKKVSNKFFLVEMVK